jgi:hypothetical protein
MNFHLVVGHGVRSGHSTGAIRGTVGDPPWCFQRGAGECGHQLPLLHDDRRLWPLRFRTLSPGDYSARPESGMSRQTTPGLHVDVDGATELAFKLAVAGNKETLTLLGPDYGTTDLRLTPRLYAGSRVKLELIVESSNLLNRDNQRIQITQDGFISNAVPFVETTNTIGISSFPVDTGCYQALSKPPTPTPRAKYKWLWKLIY